ncbi:50S ribosomal protein L13 [Candidatus Woesearchaeota archaeon]|nr:50S ribosomal protein L13 [Candidatus Woesearchaeota archaeon]
MIIDAKNQVLGRFATVAAKKALQGEDVIVVNCEKAVITGKKSVVLAKYKLLMEAGQPTKGPFIRRRPDMFVRRAIRGMLPRKRARGRDAFKRIKCFIDVPADIDAKKIETVKGADISGVATRKYVSVAEICRLIGGK